MVRSPDGKLIWIGEDATASEVRFTHDPDTSVVGSIQERPAGLAADRGADLGRRRSAELGSRRCQRKDQRDFTSELVWRLTKWAIVQMIQDMSALDYPALGMGWARRC